MVKKKRSRKTDRRVKSTSGTFHPLSGLFERCSHLPDRYLLLLIFVIAITIRIVYLNELRDAPFFYHPVGDSKIYVERAMAIAGGDIIGREAYFHSSPLYSYFMAAVFRVFGFGLTSIRFIQFLIGSLNCLLIFMLARKIPGMGRGVSVLAGLLAAGCGTLVFFDGDLLMIPLVLFFVSASLLSLVLLMERMESSRKAAAGYAILSGICLGFAGLGKPNVLLFAPFALLWIFTGFKRGFQRERWKEGVLFALACCLAVFPITLRNYVVSKDFVLVSSNAGVNFFIGNNIDADGIFMLPPSSGLDNTKLYLSSRTAAEKSTGTSGLKPSQVSRYWTGRAIEFIANHPGDAAKLLFRKFLLFWNRYEIPNHHNIYFISLYYAGFLKKLFVAFGWIAPLAFLGIVASLIELRSSRVIRLYLAFLLVYMAGLILFFITARYRLPVVPFFVVFASYGIHTIIRLIRRRCYARFTLLLGVGVVWALIVHLPIVEYDFGFSHTVMGTVYSDLATEEPEQGVAHIEKAILEYKKALELRPLSVDAHYNLGVAFQRVGYFSGAVRALGAAYELQPSHAYAAKALAESREALEQNGDRIRDEALPLTPFELGLKYSKKGNTMLAKANYEIALRQDPHHAPAYSELGAMKFSNGDYAGAISLFKKGLRYQPHHFVLNNNIAGAYYKTGDLEKAKRHWEKCLEIKPDNEGVKRQLRLISG